MEFVFIVGVILAVGDGGHSSPPAAECPALNDGRSLMAGMLDVLGFNHTCIAASLDFCSSAQEDGDFAILVEVRARPCIHAIILGKYLIVSSKDGGNLPGVLKCVSTGD